jgi:outer membrane protein assembly factor BamB
MRPPSRRQFLRSTAAVGAAGLAGCSSSCPDRDAPTPGTVLDAGGAGGDTFDSTPGGEWPAPRYGAGNAGYAPDSIPPGEDVERRWTTRLGETAASAENRDVSSPVVADGRAFLAQTGGGGGGGGVHALSLRDGAEAWRTTDVAPTTVPPTFGYDRETAPPVIAPDGSVLVAETGGLTALDPSDGSERWSYAGVSSTSVPAAVDDAVYVAGDGALAALDPADGSERWTASTALEEVNVPAVADDAVVVADRGRTRVFDAASGDPLWSVDRGTETYPVVADGTVYLGDYEGLRALALADGDARWTFERGSGRSISSPVVGPETLYVVEQPGEGPAATFALDRTDGAPSPRWCSYIAEGAATGAAGGQSFVIRPGAGYGPEPTPSLVVFTDRFGEAVWGVASDRSVLPPAILDEAVVVADRRGTVTAVGGR